MFGIGLPELIVIFVLALLIFGPKRLPELGQTVGKWVSELRGAAEDISEDFRKSMEPRTPEDTSPKEIHAKKDEDRERG